MRDAKQGYVLVRLQICHRAAAQTRCSVDTLHVDSGLQGQRVANKRALWSRLKDINNQ